MNECNLKRRSTDGDDSCPFVAKAADQAVKKVFAIVGVDIDKPESVESFREDLRFGRKLRKAADHGSLVLTALLISGMVYAMWDGLKTAIRGH